MRIIVFGIIVVLSQFLNANTKPLMKTASYIESLSKQYLGDRYVWGGSSPETGMDCSGYVKYVFNKAGIDLPRTAYSQSKIGDVVDKSDLRKGDLLFFLTDKSRHIPITHVGIYMGNGKFIHAASTKKGIIMSSIKQGYYAQRLKFAKRVIGTDTNTVQQFYVTLDAEAAKSSMEVTLTSFGGVNDTAF